MAAFEPTAGSATTYRSDTGSASSHDPQRGQDSRPAGRQPLTIPTTFCPTDAATPFDTTEWDLRTAAIKGEDGKVLFEQTACEIPAAWTQLATNVVVS